MQDNIKSITPALKIGQVNVLCPHHCGFVASGEREWMAVHRMGEHLITQHLAPMWTRPTEKAS